jgi:hypothetical protein
MEKCQQTNTTHSTTKTIPRKSRIECEESFGEDEDKNIPRQNRHSTHQKMKGSTIRSIKRTIANTSALFLKSHWIKEK